MDRRQMLECARDEFEIPLWRLVEQLERCLASLAAVPHFDSNDPTAVGAAIHSALPSALADSGLEEKGFALERYAQGPCYKLVSSVGATNPKRSASIELHFAGPQGGTSKSAHQFANQGDDKGQPLPGFELAAPKALLFFLAYHLTPTKTKVGELFLMFADSVDRQKIKLQRPEASHSAEPAARPADLGPENSTQVKAKKNAARGDERRDETTKRGDASSGA